MTLGVRPPRRDASQTESLRFIRDLQLRSFVVTVPGLLLAALAGAPLWAIALGAVAIAALVLDAVLLTRRIRRG
jgi:hypothetical protein